jgi:hypothetical protein
MKSFSIVSVVPDIIFMFQECPQLKINGSIVYNIRTVRLCGAISHLRSSARS